MIPLRVGDFLAADPQALVAHLAREDMQQFRGSERTQIRAWEQSITILASSLADWPEANDFQVILEYPMLRLGKRIDCVLVTPNGIIVIEFKTDAANFTAADRQQAEDYALDLQDFHSACRKHPILPILVATHGRPKPAVWPLLLPGVAGTVLEASAATLGDVLRGALQRFPATASLNVAAWSTAAYRPVPGIVEAARTLYLRHDVADIVATRADVQNLTVTTDAILAAIKAAEQDKHHAIIFVTGIPSAGKTLCGLNAVFGIDRHAGATFLTGNPTLVLVLREALARDAAKDVRAAIHDKKRQLKSPIQALPHVRDYYVKEAGELPAEHVVVIDEAQRCWSADYARQATRTRQTPLTDSEPGHILDIMARHRDWAAILCLVGGGQEIHTGEGGLAEWASALRRRPMWRVHAAPGLADVADPRQRLASLPHIRESSSLHLHVPVRNLRHSAAAAWVDAMLRSDAATARQIAAQSGTLPFRLTRDLCAMRQQLRTAARGLRRAGLVASAGAKRLRADGLGVELPHMDAAAVGHWFLDYWPDVRASNALEVVATQFACQGLELDHVGLCWAGDLIRRSGWVVRNFAGKRWTIPTGEEAIANRLNTYRVLLTRARYETVIWVPQGDPADRTRDPAEFDAIADYLALCGVPRLDPVPPSPAPIAELAASDPATPPRLL